MRGQGLGFAAVRCFSPPLGYLPLMLLLCPCCLLPKPVLSVLRQPPPARVQLGITRGRVRELFVKTWLTCVKMPVQWPDVNVPWVANLVSCVTKPCAWLPSNVLWLNQHCLYSLCPIQWWVWWVDLKCFKGLAYVKPMYGLCQAGLCQANVYVCYFNW